MEKINFISLKLFLEWCVLYIISQSNNLEFHRARKNANATKGLEGFSLV